MAVDGATLEQLRNPPINEVVCGVIFDPIPALDPLVMGMYWAKRQEEYPNKALVPPLADGPVIPMGATDLLPFRSWLISQDDATLLQIQPDRFYLNWRRREEGYPRFSDHNGRQSGILSKLLREFDLFAAFCRETLNVRPSPHRLDLAKVDWFVEGKHWRDGSDLVRLLPCLKGVSSLASTPKPELRIQFAEPRASGIMNVSITCGRQRQEENSLVILETRVSAAPEKDIGSVFARMNGELNSVFASLIPEEERNARFGTQP